jgi:hypothetical protein
MIFMLIDVQLACEFVEAFSPPLGPQPMSFSLTVNEPHALP